MAATTIINGLAIGASLSVTDSTALSNLDPNGLTIGTSVSDLGTPATWILTISTAALSSTVKAVKGITGWRWVQATSGGVSSIAVAGNLATSGATGAITLTGPDTGATTSIGAAVQDVDIVVDGELDGGWELEFDIVPTNGSTLFLQPNALTSNLKSVRLQGQPGGSPSATASTAQTTWLLCDAGTDGRIRGYIRFFHSKTGFFREAVADCWRDNFVLHTFMEWQDTSTAITSLRFHSDTASGIVSGYIRKRKIGWTG